jgi:hypothetical protein
MSVQQNILPPELPNRDGRLPQNEPMENGHLWLLGGIAALVLLLIILATLISLTSPRVGQVNHGEKGLATAGSGDKGKEEKPIEEVSQSESKSQAAIDSTSSRAESVAEPEAVDALRSAELSEQASPESSENSQPIQGAEESQMSQEPASDMVKGEVDEPFVIQLPTTRKLDDSRPPANSATTRSPLRQRSAESRLENLESYGGTAESELAVAAALEWLARHQLPSGGWSFDHSPSCDGSCLNRSAVVNAQQDPQVLANAATGLCLLPFLGAGFTHRDGKYQKVVDRGIRFLLKSQQRDAAFPKGASWMEFMGFMYSHGIASMALCEAYAMTEDPELRPAAQAAVHFIATAQHRSGGGWRYQPGDQGDMSMLGWQLMALKSGEIGGLSVNKKCFSGAESFIDSLRVPTNGVYGYTAAVGDGDDTCTTGIGALGLYYLGRDNRSAEQQASVKYLIANGPVMDDLYGLYYTTQAVMHLGGDDWPAWNEKVREHLIGTQEKSGHAKGSWFVAGSGAHRVGAIGGRTYCTAMSAMTLEVYYRHLPLYVKKKP